MTVKYDPPALRKAVRILTILAEIDAPVRLTQLTDLTGYGKSTVYGLLSTLEDVRWVEKEGPGSRSGYRLGKGLIDLVKKADRLSRIVEIARPFLDKLAARTGESVLLGERRRDSVLVLACADGPSEMRLSSRPGIALPLFAAALGKAFLSDLPEEELERFFDSRALPRFTERSITDPGAFLEEVRKTKSRGWSVDDEEYLRGVRAVAAPIRYGDRVAAAVWCVGFVSSLTDEGMDSAGRELKDAADTVSRLMERG